jgi:CheY-like chemotaxis protein
VGTTFTVRLLMSEAAATPASSTADTRAITGYHGARRTVLLIDDDASHVDIVQSLLAPLDFKLFSASSGPSGLKLAAECRPDLAMLDLSMPGMTGWQVAEAMRALPGLDRLRIVIVSANAHEFSPGGAQTHHDAFLIKPIDMQRVLECVEQQLNLSWIYEPGSSNGKTGGGEHTGADLPVHSRHHVDDLYQLGLIGHVRGIQAKLREMENDPTNKPFATRMRTLVANFDLKRYMNVLEGMRKHA